jgi:hypothetical protein
MDSSSMNPQQYGNFLKREFDFSEKQAPPHRVIRGGEGLFGLQALEESIHPLSFITKKMKFSREVGGDDEGKGKKRMKKPKYSVSWGDPLKAKYIAAFCVPGKIHIYHGVERDVERMFVIDIIITILCYNVSYYVMMLFIADSENATENQYFREASNDYEHSHPSTTNTGRNDELSTEPAALKNPDIKKPETTPIVTIPSHIFLNMRLAKPLSTVTTYRKSGMVESMSFRTNAFSMILANESRPGLKFTQAYTHHPLHYPMRHPTSTLIIIITQVVLKTY